VGGDRAGRAVLVGKRTAGDTGQIITFSLPGGGLLWVCTKWDFQPDGQDLIGIGLRPEHEVPQVLDDLLGGDGPRPGESDRRDQILSK
jgi:carboxyl-terminal processing protease